MVGLLKHKCDVAPRYTPGSPGWVDAGVAQRVAAQEKDAIEGRLEGYYGPEEQYRAQRLGLDWIAWTTTYKGSKAIRTDLITGNVLTHPIMENGRRFVPVYNSEQMNFPDAVRRLQSAKIKMQEWTEQPTGSPQRRLFCVEASDLPLAYSLLTGMGLLPLPDLHAERRVA